MNDDFDDLPDDDSDPIADAHERADRLDEENHQRSMVGIPPVDHDR